MKAANVPRDTCLALQTLAVGQCSRSLYFDRFAQPDIKEDARRKFFNDGFGCQKLNSKSNSWKEWLRDTKLGFGLNPEDILFAQLQSRLMVNMAGGVMENAGLCLDRFGLSYIPGSAVKGCARRMAIQNLLEARQSGEPEHKLAAMLTDIALVFGWGEQDWQPGRDKSGILKSDFVYAVGEEQWGDIFAIAGKQLLGMEPATDKDFGQFAGAVSFLPAYPHQLPANDLELDVVTCHHPDYYSQKKDRQNNLIMPVALDTEDPNPVFFPAVSPGNGTEQDRCVFAFVTLPLRGERHSLRQPEKKLHQLAKDWLRESLGNFGLGAKTAAGYGWFDASEKFNRLIAEKEAQETATLREQQEAIAEKMRQKKQEEERARKKEADKQALASLTPEKQEDYKIAQLTPDQFRAKLDNFLTNKAETEKQAIVRALRIDTVEISSRRAFWDDLKLKAQKKGGKFAQIEQTIRQISKQMFPGKEGKMP